MVSVGLLGVKYVTLDTVGVSSLGSIIEGRGGGKTIYATGVGSYPCSLIGSYLPGSGVRAHVCTHVFLAHALNWLHAWYRSEDRHMPKTHTNHIPTAPLQLAPQYRSEHGHPRPTNTHTHSSLAAGPLVQV